MRTMAIYNLSVCGSISQGETGVAGGHHGFGGSSNLGLKLFCVSNLSPLLGAPGNPGKSTFKILGVCTGGKKVEGLSVGVFFFFKEALS